MNIKQFTSRLRTIIEYILSAAIIVVFALYCSGRVGWFLLLVLLLTPVLSITVSAIISKFISIDADINSLMLNKKNKCAITVTINNSFILPTPPVRVELFSNTHFKCATIQNESESIYTFILPRNHNTHTLEFLANYSGGSFLGIKNVTITDYLGIVSFNISNKLETIFKWKVGIIPEFAEIKEDNTILKQSLQTAFGEGESEDTIDETNYTFGGFPGFDYREYQPGDPLKRINSKLSAKTGDLYVRLDEKLAFSEISIVLNPYIHNEEPLTSQNALEESLGLAKFLLSRDYAVSYYLQEDNNWCNYRIDNEGALIDFSKKLANYIFNQYSDNTNLFPKELIEQNTKTNTVIYASSVINEHIHTTLANIKENNEISINIYCTENGEGISL